MGRYLVVIGVLLASTAVADAAEWGITPPPGWKEDAAAVRKARDEVKAAAPGLQEVEVGIWSEEATGATLGVHWYRLALDSNPKAQVDAFDRGVVRGLRQVSGSTPPDGGSAGAGDRAPRVVGSMAIRETIVDQFQGNPIHMRVVRRYQPATDGLHALIATCASVSENAACNAAIDAVRWEVAHPVALDDGLSKALHQFEQPAGKGLVFCAVGLVVWALVRRRKRSPPVTAAAPPGSPPGPGGAADGT